MRNYVPAQETRAHPDLIEYAFQFLEQAARFAVVPISQFHVGAIAIDAAGNFYFGANWENDKAALGQTIHAEQSAISHAWLRGAEKITDIVVNYTPCGHCRQFMNELRGADNLRIHLPHQRGNLLRDYLPDSFGPDNLGISTRLLDPEIHPLQAKTPNLLFEHALQAARMSYAPYSQTFAGVALQTKDGEIFTGRYAENAAYNPSLPPLQVAINVLRLAGQTPDNIEAAALVCPQHSGHLAQADSLWRALSLVPLEVEFYFSDHG